MIWILVLIISQEVLCSFSLKDSIELLLIIRLRSCFSLSSFGLKVSFNLKAYTICK